MLVLNVNLIQPKITRAKVIARIYLDQFGVSCETVYLLLMLVDPAAQYQ